MSNEYEHSTLPGNTSRSWHESYILKSENECKTMELMTREVALFCILDHLMKIVGTFTAMVMAKMSPDEHFSEHYLQDTIDIASG